jgi:hypothetical protein
MTARDHLFDDICARLDELSDKQLTNLIEVVRVTQVEREDDRIATDAGC